MFNVQVGKGKTTICYNLIEQYVKQGYKVIVVSPFKKLVEKDFNTLTARGLNTFQYGQLTDDATQNINLYLNCDVQVMTINCLLQNPGEDAFAQRFIKRNYLENLHNSCTYQKKKVVIFFDEIHESIHNFKRQFIPNLHKWAPVTHKCYVASATFTPASVPVIKYISTLTNGIVSICETPRLKTSNQSELYIHIIKDPYNGNNLKPLGIITNIINNNTAKRVNILSGHNSIVKALTNITDNNTELYNAIQSLNLNITNGDGDNPFNINRNNIGTTFKTGVDIINKDAVLIIIHPYLQDGNHYGIFTDGLPSLIQSVARNRKNGQVHIITGAPQVSIDKEKLLKLSGNNIFDLPDVPYLAQNNLYIKLKEDYERQYEEKKSAITSLLRLQEQDNINLNYSYPTFEEYLIEHSATILPRNYPSYAKGLSPYTIWAGLNDQFVNTTLKELTLTHRRRQYINLTTENIHQKFSTLISEEAIQQVQKQPVYKAIEIVIEHIKSNSDKEIIFSYKSAKYSLNQLIDSPYIMQTLLKFIYNGINKENYILGCCLQSLAVQNSLFKNLERGRQWFLNFLRENMIVNSKKDILISKDVYKHIPDKYIDGYKMIISRLNHSDIFISSRIFPLVPKIDSVPYNKLREIIYKELEKCFTNISSVKKSYNGNKDQYYLVQGNIERQPPHELRNTKFL